MAVDSGRYLLTNVLSILENDSNLSEWHVSALIITDTGGNQVTDDDMLLILDFYLFAQYLL